MVQPEAGVRNVRISGAKEAANLSVNSWSLPHRRSHQIEQSGVSGGSLGNTGKETGIYLQAECGRPSHLLLQYDNLIPPSISTSPATFQESYFCIEATSLGNSCSLHNISLNVAIKKLLLSTTTKKSIKTSVYKPGDFLCNISSKPRT